jgi:hypothetical protein
VPGPGGPEKGMTTRACDHFGNVTSYSLANINADTTVYIHQNPHMCSVHLKKFANKISKNITYKDDKN